MFKLLVGVPKPRPLGSVCEVVLKVGANIGSWASASGMLVGVCAFNWSTETTVTGVGIPEPLTMREPVTVTDSVATAAASLLRLGVPACARSTSGLSGVLSVFLSSRTTTVLISCTDWVLGSTAGWFAAAAAFASAKTLTVLARIVLRYRLSCMSALDFFVV